MRKLLLVLTLGLAGCGQDTITGPEPQPSPSVGPSQTILGLALTARQDGNIVESVRRDTFFTVESASRCTVAELPCPRPSKVRWQVSGAFCETLGDITGPTIGVLCGQSGVTRIEATDLERGTQGSIQVQVTL